MARNRHWLISVVFVSLLAWVQIGTSQPKAQSSSILIAQVQDDDAPQSKQAPPAYDSAPPVQAGSPPQAEEAPTPDEIAPEQKPPYEPEPDVNSAPPDNGVPPQQPDINSAPTPDEEAAPSEVENPPQSQLQRAPRSGVGNEEGVEAAPQSQGTPQPEVETASPYGSSAATANETEAMQQDTSHGPAIWRMPHDIASLDLFYGQGGRKGIPKAPFTFINEDRHGSNPKFDARDATHRKWKVKLGIEARPEVVASRLLWAVGYYVNDDYVLPKARVRGLRMERHSDKQRGTEVIDARFARRPHGDKKVGSWKWKDNPFFGTREFNGLRVMMALLNNWDLKDSNNAVYEDPHTHQRVYLVSDVGSTFGTSGRSWTSNMSKAGAAKYKRSKFIVRDTGTEVDFATPASAGPLLAESFGFAAPRFLQYERTKWIGKNIPNPDAHWIGTLLGQLSHQQLVDAFRAGNFSAREIEVYVQELESRIKELKAL